MSAAPYRGTTPGYSLRSVMATRLGAAARI